MMEVDVYEKCKYTCRNDDFPIVVLPPKRVDRIKDVYGIEWHVPNRMDT